MGVEFPLCIVVTLSQNAVMFSRVKLSSKLFVLLLLLARLQNHSATHDDNKTSDLLKTIYIQSLEI